MLWFHRVPRGILWRIKLSANTVELLGSSSVQTHCLKLSLGGFRVVQSCAETKLRDFGGKLECLFTVILIIRVFSVTSPMKEAKL